MLSGFAVFGGHVGLGDLRRRVRRGPATRTIRSLTGDEQVSLVEPTGPMVAIVVRDCEPLLENVTSRFEGISSPGLDGGEYPLGGQLDQQLSVAPVDHGVEVTSDSQTLRAHHRAALDAWSLQVIVGELPEPLVIEIDVGHEILSVD